MPAFLVGTVRITDAEAFTKYGAAIKGLSANFGGESIMAGAVMDVMEGNSPVGERVVVSKFPTAELARAYLTSPAYLAAKALRAGAAEVELRLIEI